MGGLLGEKEKKVGEEGPCVTSGAEYRMIFQPILLFTIYRY